MKYYINNKASLINKKNIAGLLLCFTFAFILTVFPWDKFRYNEFVDRSNYINYIDVYTNKIHWFDYSTLISKISYEWGWHYFLSVLQEKFNFNSSAILFIVSIFFLTIAFYIVRLHKKPYIFILFLNPLFVDFFYSQIRLTFAISFLYLSLIFFREKKYIAIPLIIVSFFIHTSSFIFLFIFYSSYFLESFVKIEKKIKLLMSLMVGLVSAVITGPYMSVLLGSFEDRRADYENMSSPTLYMIYWLLLFFYIIAKSFFTKNSIIDKYYFYITISILTMVFMNIFASGYSSRFLVAAFPFIVMTLSHFRKGSDAIVLIGYISYNIILWFFWLT